MCNLLLDSFKRDPEERPYALDLAEQIQDICKQRPRKYIGECCVLDDIVNISSNLEHAIAGTVHTLPSPEDLEQGSLLLFVASMSLSLGSSDILEAYPSLNTLYRQSVQWENLQHSLRRKEISTHNCTSKASLPFTFKITTNPLYRNIAKTAKLTCLSAMALLRASPKPSSPALTYLVSTTYRWVNTTVLTRQNTSRS